MQNKIFNEVYENNKNLSKIDFNEDWFNFLDFIKKNMIKNKMFENLTISDLKILKLPLDQLKNKLNNNDKNNKIPIFQNENEINNIKNNKLNEIDEEEKKINDDIENILLKYGKDIEQLKSKQNKNNFVNNNNNINDNIIEKMWNETKNIENRTFYNDNPYHYGYNYEGSSIDIKKFITKTTSFNNNNNNIKNNIKNNKNNKKKITKSSSKKYLKKI
jgi:hypothetical protein